MVAGLCRAQNEPKHAECFASGDGRVNEQPGLASMHTVWLRAHNRIASGLGHLNPHWTDNRLYAEARRIAGAMMQHITYNEFLPLVLGPEVIRLFGLNLLRTGACHLNTFKGQIGFVHMPKSIALNLDNKLEKRSCNTFTSTSDIFKNKFLNIT